MWRQWVDWARAQVSARLARYHEAELQLQRQQAGAAEAHWLQRVTTFLLPSNSIRQNFRDLTEVSRTYFNSRKYARMTTEW